MSKKQPPTLLDAAVRESLRGDGFVSPKFTQPLLNARKFVLDEPMSEFLSELSHGPFHDAKTLARRPVIAEQMRITARLPHALTWVEYDARALKRHTLQRWGDGSYQSTKLPWESKPSEEETIARIGWLLEQHPKIENAFRCTVFATATNEGDVLAFPFSFAWVAGEEPLPWNTLPLLTHEAPSMLAVGIMGYLSPRVGYVQSMIGHDLTELIRKESTYTLIRDFVGELRRVWSLLSTLGDLPIVFKEVRAAKGYVAKGRYRKYSNYSVITLTVPATEYRVVAKKALAYVRRIAHHVRGHWRKDYRNRGNAACEHHWEAAGSHLQCRCGARKLWITEHTRGDASLGFRLHDYKITHEHETPQ